MLSLRCELRRVTEISKLDVALSVNEDVVTLDISVDHVFLMESV